MRVLALRPASQVYCVLHPSLQWGFLQLSPESQRLIRWTQCEGTISMQEKARRPWHPAWPVISFVRCVVRSYSLTARFSLPSLLKDWIKLTTLKDKFNKCMIGFLGVCLAVQLPSVGILLALTLSRKRACCQSGWAAKRGHKGERYKILYKVMAIFPVLLLELQLKIKYPIYIYPRIKYLTLFLFCILFS